MDPVQGGAEIEGAYTERIHRVPAWDVPLDQISPDEEHYIHEHRWWAVHEIVATDEPVYPPGLAATLHRILGL